MCILWWHEDIMSMTVYFGLFWQVLYLYVFYLHVEYFFYLHFTSPIASKDKTSCLISENLPQ